MAKKFKAIEKKPVNSPIKENLEWEGEEVGAVSSHKIEDDKGEGREVILRFFEFAANPETFKEHKPTAQELFGTHQRGIESLIWTDGWQPFTEVEPRIQFSKDNKRYRIIVACIPAKGNLVLDKTRTLKELIK